MRDSRIEHRLRAGAWATLAATGVAVLIPLVQVPFLLHWWNPGEYGMWLAILAAFGLLTSLDSGHQTYVGNEINRHWKTQPQQTRILLGSAVWTAGAIALLEILAAFGLWAGWGQRFLPAALSPEGHLGLLILMGYWCAVGSVNGVLVKMYPSGGRFARGQWLGVLHRAGGFLTLLLAAAAGGGLVGAAAAQAVFFLVFSLWIARDLRLQFPAFFPWWCHGSPSVALRNLGRSAVLTGNQVAEQVSSGGLILLAAAKLSPADAASWASLRTLSNAALQALPLAIHPLLPDLIRYQGEKEGKKIRAVITAFWALIPGLMGVGLILFSEPAANIFRLWTRGVLDFESHTFGLLVVAVSLRVWASPCFAYLSGINDLRSQTAINLLRAGCGLGGALFLGHGHGLALLAGGILAGEACAAYLSLCFTRNQLAVTGETIPGLTASLPLGQLLLAALPYFWSETPVLFRIPSAFGLMGVLFLLFRIQWKRLSPDQKTRFRQLFRPEKSQPDPGE